MIQADRRIRYLVGLSVISLLLIVCSLSGTNAIANLPDDPFSGAPALDPSELTGPTAPPLNAQQLAEIVAQQVDHQEGDGTNAQYPNLNGTQATALLDDVFGPAIAGLVYTPAESLEQADEVDRYLGDTGALIDPAGPRQHALVDATVPLVTDDGDPVDLSLVQSDDGFEPRNALAETALPDDLGSPAVLGDDSFEVGFPGTNENSEARTLSVDQDTDKEVVVYPDAKADADLALAPATDGVEYMVQIRSSGAPESFPIEVQGIDLTLEEAEDGSVVIKDGENQIGAISPAVSIDANGKMVPTTMSVTGNRVAIKVNHQTGDFSYPILMDPIVESWDWWTAGQSSYDFSAWTPTQTSGSNYQLTTTCSSGVTDSCQASGRGLYINARPNYSFTSGSYGQWVYNVPWSEYGSSNNTYIASATSNSWRYMHGTATNTNPYGYMGTYGSGAWTQYKQYVGVGGGGSGNNFSGGMTTKQFIAGLGSAANLTLPAGGWRFLRVAAMIINLDDGTPTDPGNPAQWYFDPAQVPSGWVSLTPFNLTPIFADAGLGVKSIGALSAAKAGGWWGDLWSAPINGVAGQPPCTGLANAKCPRVVAGTVNIRPAELANGLTTVALYGRDALTKQTNGSSFQLKVDNKPPVITDTSGSATNPTNPGVDLHIEANDGDSSVVRSGIKRIEVDVAGQGNVYDETLDCVGAYGECPRTIERDIPLPAPALAGGSGIEVTVTDAVGLDNFTPEYWPIAMDPEDLYVNPDDGYPAATASGVCPSSAKPLSPKKGSKNGGPKTLVGTVCKDIIDLSEPYFKNAETVYGGKSDDVIRAFEGDQTIYGGPGNDRIFGGFNNDKLHGGLDDDLLGGGVGDDDMWGDGGDDRLIGSHGADKHWGGTGSDYMRGGQGTDSYNGGTNLNANGSENTNPATDTGRDTVSFGDAVTPGFQDETYMGLLPSGFPSLYSEERGVLVRMDLDLPRANNGSARLGGAEDYLCVKKAGKMECANGKGTIERIIGSPFSDKLVGTSATQILVGGAGSDYLVGNGGSDSLYGGPGSDALDGGSTAADMSGGAASSTEPNYCVNTSGTKSNCQVQNGTLAVVPRQRNGTKITVGMLQPNESDGKADPREANVYLKGSSSADNVIISHNSSGNTVSFRIGSSAANATNWPSVGRFVSGQVGACSVQDGTHASCNLGDKPLGSIVVSGGPGDDRFNADGFGGHDDVYLLGNKGRDILLGSAGDDILVDGDSQNSQYAELLRGGTGEDALIQNRDKDQLWGGPGNDLLMSSDVCSGDYINGEGGSDNSQWAQLPRPYGVAENQSTTGVYIDLSKHVAGRYYRDNDNSPADQSQPNCNNQGGVADVYGIEKVEASGNPDKVIGNDGNNFLLGRSGKDSLWGGDGFDTINAKDGTSKADLDAWYHIDDVINCGMTGSAKGGQASYAPSAEFAKANPTCKPDGGVQARYGQSSPPYYREVGDPDFANATAAIFGDVVDEDEPVASEGSVTGSWDGGIETPQSLYPFTETTGTSANNVTGTGGDGQYVASPAGNGPTLGVMGGLQSVRGDEAVELDGSNDQVDIESDLGVADSDEDGYAIEIRFQFTSAPTNGDVLFSKGDDDDGLELSYRDGEIRFDVRKAQVERTVSSYGFAADANWHHAVAQVNGDDIQLYVDGIGSAVGFDEPVVAGNSAGDPLVVGAVEDQVAGHSAVVVDSLAVYDQALTEPEILAKYGEGIGEPVDLVLSENLPQADGDGDGIIDLTDNCPANANPDQEDIDVDGLGDPCDSMDDVDGDNVDDALDNCPGVFNEDQADANSNGVGNECEAEGVETASSDDTD